MARPVRVRFAPSPTGPLHIGGVRTALYNYLFARKMGGTMILRIEDTDSQRFVPGAEEYILESLEWCGIRIDEGVGAGGPHAPYRQSERREIYLKYALQLVEAGWAYYAFDTAEELDALRREAEGRGEAFAYNYTVREKLATSLALPAEEVRARIDRGDQWVIRFRMPENEVVEMDDLIRGHVEVNTSTLDDKVLYKSADALPTYHLANIVDDRLMEVSHVIRGEEWLPSLPLHYLLYKAFGWTDVQPRFAHLPLLLKPTGGGKLSVVAVFAEILTAGLNEGDDGLRNGAGVVHHVGDRLTDDVVKRKQNDQRNERPQAAAAHGYALFLVHLLDSQLVFLLIVAVFGLKGLDLRRQAGHFEHALLALDRHRQQHQLDDQREQNQRQTVVVGEGIQPVEQIAERDTDEIGQAGCVFRLGSGSLGRSGGLHVHIFIVRADCTGGTAGHGQHEHGGKDPDQDFFLHCFPPSVMGIRVQTTGKNHAALRHRVKIVSLIKGIAPQQPLQRQPAALERPVFCNRLERILRTGR